MSRDRVRQRVQELVDGYRQRTCQPALSTRELSKQMRDSGVQITHGTLQNMLNGTTNPDRSTLRGLCGFFGVSEYYFDADPRSAEIMGRIGTLGPEGLDAVESLLADLDGR
jgi:transcriptional regulator with XRE-family HTH domain